MLYLAIFRNIFRYGLYDFRKNKWNRLYIDNFPVDSFLHSYFLQNEMSLMYCTYVFHLDTNGNIDNLEYTEASYILFISFSHVGVFMLTHDKYYTLFVMDNRVFYYSLETIIGVLYILSVYFSKILFYSEVLAK